MKWSAQCIATALVLVAVFVPTAFITGVSGAFYKQFALTIAVSTVISAFNSLNSQPGLPLASGYGRTAIKTLLRACLIVCSGWFFQGFNRFFKASVSVTRVWWPFDTHDGGCIINRMRRLARFECRDV